MFQIHPGCPIGHRVCMSSRETPGDSLRSTTGVSETCRIFIDARWYSKKMIFKDELARGDGTEYIIDSIDFDVDIPDHMLTKAALRK